ncbi:hypothetical protein QF029_005863 [Priestia megaterium]|nr:hypothetical protein [Priestia megaterium]
MQDAIGFYMLGVCLVTYIFYEMDKRSKDVPMSRLERTEDRGQ